MKIIFEAIAGSHLFGLNTPSSDKDYKGVFIPTKEDYFLQKAPKSIKRTTGDNHSKNGANDVDTEYYSINKFFEMLEQGQTVAYEMLFTPENLILKNSEEWKLIQRHTSDLVHKKCTAFIGYAKQQADKYGIRGSRMGTLEKVIEHFEGYRKDLRIEEADLEFIKCLDHVDVITKAYETPLLQVLEKKFTYTCKVEYVLDCLHKIYDNYGERSRLAKENKGIDWKALSHAYRVCKQGQELLSSGKITLPLDPIHRDIALKIKTGQLPFTEVQQLLEENLKDLIDCEKDSNLQERINKDLADNLLLECIDFAGPLNLTLMELDNERS